MTAKHKLGEPAGGNLVWDDEGNKISVRQWKELVRLQKAANAPEPRYEQVKRAQEQLKRGPLSAQDLKPSEEKNAP